VRQFERKWQPLLPNQAIERVAPALVAALLNAHENVSLRDPAKVEDLLQRLESAGHVAVADGLRRQLEAKQPKAKKAWWKV